MPVRILIVALFMLLLGACDQSPQAPQAKMDWHNTRSAVFGGPVEIAVRTSPELAARALEVAVDDLHYVAGITHPWRPGALGRTNELLAMNAEFSGNPSGLPMIRQATELYRQSEGYFNPALGHLQRLWGFHQDDLDFVLPATTEELQQVLDAAPTMDDIRIDGIRVIADNPQVRLDYGPFALGHAFDVVRNNLQGEGIAQAYLHNRNAHALLGNTQQTIQPHHYPQLGLALQADEALYTVSIEDRYYEVDGRRIHDQLHPFTGQPVRGIRHLSVIHAESAASAAAQAQALLLAGEQRLPELAQRMGVRHYLYQNEAGELFASAALQARLSDPDSVIALSLP